MKMNKAAETQGHIIESAFSIFIRKGYHGTAMGELVEKSGISKGSFYYHFKSKEGLYEAVVRTYLFPVFDKQHLTGMHDLSFDEALHVLNESYADILKSLRSLIGEGNARYYSFFFEAFEEIPAFKQVVQEFYSSLKILLADKLSNGEGLSREEAQQQAIVQIARYEGILFWSAIFPGFPATGLL